MTRLDVAEMRFLTSVAGYTRMDKIRSEVIRKELEISAIKDVRLKYKQNWISHLERTDNTRLTPETRLQLQTSRKTRSRTHQETMAMRRCRNGSNDLIHGGRWYWWWRWWLNLVVHLVTKILRRLKIILSGIVRWRQLVVSVPSMSRCIRQSYRCQWNVYILFRKNNPITSLDWSRGFQEVEAPRFQDSWHMKVVRLSALLTGRPPLSRIKFSW